MTDRERGLWLCAVAAMASAVVATTAYAVLATTSANVLLATVADRDGLEDAREKLRRMSAAGREQLLANAALFAELPVLRQREIRELQAEFQQMEPADRLTLDAAMRKLAAIVDTYPDATAHEFHQSTSDTERLNLLQRMRKQAESQDREASSRVPSVDEKTKRTISLARMLAIGGGMGAEKTEKIKQDIQAWTRSNSRFTDDDEALFRLLNRQELTMIDKRMLPRCVAAKYVSDDDIKLPAFEPEFLPFLRNKQEAVLRKLPSFAAAIGSSPMSAKVRHDFWKAISEVYLLGSHDPPNLAKKMRKVMEKKRADFRSGASFLGTQFELLKTYLENPDKIPTADKQRVEFLLGRRSS